MRGTAGHPVRLRFTKRGKVRFIGHRDVARAFDRAFRIEQLPLAFTEGFSPRPKVSFGLALSVGHESEAEYLDFELDEIVDPDELVGPLSAALPEGIDVTGAVALVDRARALQESVTAVDYLVAPIDANDQLVSASLLSELVDLAHRSTELPVTQVRKGKERVEDVLPVIRTIELVHTGGFDQASPDLGTSAVLELSLSTQPRGARPREILEALGVAAGLPLAGETTLFEGRVVRTAQWIEHNGARQEPLEADVLTRTPQVCAS
ncbi:MAG: TIGR03936 family radical SAM-associated protein [Acidimicrobiia bacterium]